MQRHLLLSIFLLSLATTLLSQNTSPYWSLSGNSGTTATSSSKLGTTTSVPLNLTTNNVTRMRITETGRIGIGTLNPQQPFHIEAPSLLSLFVSTSPLGIYSGSGTIGYTKHTPTAAGQRLGYFIMGSRGGGENNYHGAGVIGYAAGPWSSTSWPSYMAFETAPSGSNIRQERMRIAPNGNVGIGVTDPQFLLEVAGRIRLRSSSAGTAGLWLNNNANTNATGFVGVANDNHIGLWGNTGAGWGLSMNTTNGYVGIGTTSPAYPLHVQSSTAAYVIQAVSSFSGNNSRIGLLASAVNAPGYGYGVWGSGGFRGVQGVGNGGDCTGAVYGVAGAAYGNNGLGSRYGVFGTAAYGSFNAAGYFSGGVWANSYHTISDAKFKEDVTPLQNTLSQVMKLRPASYLFRTAEYKGMNLPKGRQIGLIADEVKAVFPELVQKAVHPAEYDEEDQTKVIGPEVPYEGVNYQGLIPVLIASVQEQQLQIETLTNENQRLKERNEAVEARLQKLEFLLTHNNSASVNISTAYLEQNAPNPSRGSTTIRYGVPDGASSARLTLTNSKGQLLKNININGRGAGQVMLETSSLPAGVYNYTLWIGGREADTKQLVITQ